MATRMQQRRGTAAQWISTNGGAGPVLNAGEMGWESDTNKFKIGDGVNNWSNLDYFIDANSTVNPAFGTSIVFEGATADSYETTVQVTDPTANRTITLPDVTGTVITTGNLSDITNIGVFSSTITMEGSTANDFELTLSAGDPTADRTITFPDATGTVALTTDIAAGTVTETGTQTLTNKTLTSPVVSGLALSDSSIVFEGSSADDNETTLTVTNPTGDRTITLPDATGTVITTGNLHNITEFGVLTSAIVMEGTTANDFELTISAGDPTADRTVTFPDATGTVALTNNKLDVFAATTSAELRTVISDETGTGGLVFADTPTLVTPNIGAATGTSLVLSGDLTVNGTTTTINSTTLAVDDKNIVLGDVETPTDTTADGGGMTLKGATDKTFNWVDATDSWTSSEHINLASDKSYYINGTLLKDVSETLTNKTLTTPVISSISNTGTLTLPTSTDTLVGRDTTDTLTNKTLSSAVATTALTLNATAELRLADTDSSHYVGFKAPETVTTNKIWTLPAADGAAGQVLTTDGSGVFSFSTPAAGAAFSELMLIGA
jgi:hypothetical protein